MSSEFDGVQEEPRDFTKWIWLGVIVIVLAMVGAMYLFAGPESNQSLVRVRHILIAFNAADPADRSRAYELATELRERILAGEDMAKLAGEYSDDEFTMDRGGLLARSPKGSFVDGFEDYAWEGEVGELSDVIQSQFGFHLVRIEERIVSDVDKLKLEQERKLREELRQGDAAPEASTEDAPAE